MLIDRNKYNECGDEFISPELELQHKCVCAYDCIQEKIFTFEETLEAYKITKENYLKFYPEE